MTLNDARLSHRRFAVYVTGRKIDELGTTCRRILGKFKSIAAEHDELPLLIREGMWTFLGNFCVGTIRKNFEGKISH